MLCKGETNLKICAKIFNGALEKKKKIRPRRINFPMFITSNRVYRKDGQQKKIIVCVCDYRRKDGWLVGCMMIEIAERARREVAQQNGVYFFTALF